MSKTKASLAQKLDDLAVSIADDVLDGKDIAVEQKIAALKTLSAYHAMVQRIASPFDGKGSSFDGYKRALAVPSSEREGSRDADPDAGDDDGPLH